MYKRRKLKLYSNCDVMYKKIICLNCNIAGHTFKNCSKPVKSYGIIAYKVIEDSVKFLLIQRKDTIGFTDFIRGRYKTLNKIDMGKIKNLVEEMTDEEKKKILSEDFDKIWDDLWIDHSSNIYINEKEKAKKLFNEIDIKNIIECSIPSRYKYTEYGFPKGRRSAHEQEFCCAAREFKEETGLKDGDFRICVNFNPVSENFIGSDNTKYTHIYYLAEIIKDVDLTVTSSNYDEVKKVVLSDYREAYKLFRNYDSQKKFTLSKVNDFLKKQERRCR